MHPIRLAVSHPDEPGRAALAVRLRGATFEPCGDLAQLRGPPDGPDAVMLVGPPTPDLTTVGQLLATKSHALLVADPCPSGETIQGLFASAQSAGVRLAVVNPDRYLPSRRLVRRQLPVPLGEPGLIRLHRWEPTAAAHPCGLPDPLLRDLDTVLWLTGRRPNCVFAVAQKSDDVAGRCLQVHLGFPGGGMALLDFTDRLPPGDSYRSLSVIASNGATYADDHDNVQLLYRGGHPQAVRTEERAGQLAAIAQDFVDALRTGREPDDGAAAWRDVFAVADAVRRSLATSRAVTPEGH